MIFILLIDVISSKLHMVLWDIEQLFASSSDSIERDAMDAKGMFGMDRICYWTALSCSLESVTGEINTSITGCLYVKTIWTLQKFFSREITLMIYRLVAWALM